MKCPNCGSESTGAFCAECGAALKGAKCRECKAPLPAGARFCTACGASVRVGAAPRSLASLAPWIVAGGALVVLLLVLVWPSISGKPRTAVNDGRVPLSQMDGSAGGEAQGPLSGSPREQADRLFNRVMTERENGDTARAKFFLPMAVQAYEIAGDLDADGLYHLSMLQDFSGDHKAARATAERVLATTPNHLLALSAAGHAARGEGDSAAARKYFQAFLAAYDSEIKVARSEYVDHARMMPELKKEAEEFR